MLEEKNSLSAEIRQLQAEMKDMQLQIIEGKAEWRSLQRSSEHINQTLSRLQDMGPLIKQIERLQMLTETMPRSDNDSEGEGNSSEEYVNVDRDQVRKECVAMQSSLVL
jgi:septal ring factor EnvC (AmiA/AmiB activator)